MKPAANENFVELLFLFLKLVKKKFFRVIGEEVRGTMQWLIVKSRCWFLIIAATLGMIIHKVKQTQALP